MSRPRFLHAPAICLLCALAPVLCDRALGQMEGPATAPSTQPAETPPPIDKKRGILVGTVLAHDGQPAVELAMRLVEEQPLGMGGGPRGEKLTTKFTTDKDGKFEVTNIKPSLYKVIAGNKDIGWIYQDVEIIAGKTEKLELKLAKVAG